MVAMEALVRLLAPSQPQDVRCADDLVLAGRRVDDVEPYAVGVGSAR
jgi:hypothetical protein